MKYFSISEFDSPDKLGSGSKMKKSTLEMIDMARGFAGIPFIVNSGYRTKAHNKEVKGIDSSTHRRGYAVDIHCRTSRARQKIITALIRAGFNRIGIAPTFIHADNDPIKPINVFWMY